MRKPPRKYIISDIISTISNCKSKKEFRINHSGEYEYVKRHKLHHLMDGLEASGNLVKRLLYEARFSDNSIYIGLTCNFEKRIEGHLLCGSVFDHIQKINEIPTFNKLTDYDDVGKIAQLEMDTISFYKNSEFNCLNKRRGGEIGTVQNRFYTFDNCLEKALLCSSKTEFHKNYSL